MVSLSATHLLSTDLYCVNGGDQWLSCELWLPKHRTQKASTAQKEYMRGLGLEVPKGLLMHEARRVLAESVSLGDKLPAKMQRGAEMRMTGLMSQLNGERGYGHPFKYVNRKIAEEVVMWLDNRHPGWDEQEKDDDGLPIDPWQPFDRWLAPAVATLHPELVKESYLAEFCLGGRWPILDITMAP